MIYKNITPEEIFENTSLIFEDDILNEENLLISDNKHKGKINLMDRTSTSSHYLRLKLEISEGSSNYNSIVYLINNKTGDARVDNDDGNMSKKELRLGNDYLKLVNSYSKYAIKQINDYYLNPVDNKQILRDTAKAFNKLSKEERKAAYEGTKKYK